MVGIEDKNGKFIWAFEPFLVFGSPSNFYHAKIMFNLRKIGPNDKSYLKDEDPLKNFLMHTYENYATIFYC